MKAFTYYEYGQPDVLRLEEVEKPTPKADEVLVRVKAVSLNVGDWYMLSGTPYLSRLFSGGLRKPKQRILGNDFAGEVVAVGQAVTGFKVGDAVYGESGFGAFAEYTAVNQNYLANKPANLSFEEAAAVPVAGATALVGVRDKSPIQAGQQVLVNGASGGVGTYVVQVARALGAEVTAVCSTRKMDMVRAIGADHVIDYTKEDFARGDKKYDIIFGVNGYRTLSDYKQALKPDGSYICIGGTMKQIFHSMLLGPLATIGTQKKISNMGPARAARPLLVDLKEMIEAGQVKPVMDRCYPFERLPEAMAYLGQGHAMGKVSLSLEGMG